MNKSDKRLELKRARSSVCNHPLKKKKERKRAAEEDVCAFEGRGGGKGEVRRVLKFEWLTS